ncbi:probable N-acetyltransferase camello [Pelobates cultripes]|uniref:Probable N-acetyltransferase camello n=1 Tax=Pelobates cultripes TaxID=61616 RepID=A0AAD1WC47_PELCU|nr:probable N-acetyltransferase camello [Pelobates cultripes]
MSDYHIRLYQDSDYDRVRDLFAKGILEHTQVAFSHALTLPHIWIFMTGVFLLPLLASCSFIISVLSVFLVLAGLWLGTQYLYISYVKHALSDDLLDVKKYYLQRDGYCFWVAESAGEVVGTVAATPSFYPGGERHIELKRMSVAQSHRGKGIAKALCRTLIDFARKRGCEAVILGTSHSQRAAQILYEAMGFRLQSSEVIEHIFGKAVNFKVLTYRYDIPTNKL